MTLPIEKPIALVILDGWGISDNSEKNALKAAHTPYYDALCSRFGMTPIAASGILLNQLEGTRSEPESGHLCMGTGRAAQHDLARVEMAIQDGSLENSEILLDALRSAASRGSTIHLIGMLSDAGVHSSANTLFTLLRTAKRNGINDVAVHCILDGVDVPARTADIYLEALEIKMADIGIGHIASLCGRYFAMDSGGNWERTARAYTMLVHGDGEHSIDPVTSIRNSFLRGISDEFIAPIVIAQNGSVRASTVKDGDLVIYFNHRPETMRQLVRSLSFPDTIGTPKPIIETLCLVEYDRSTGLPVILKEGTAKFALPDVLAASKVKLVRSTQSERFPHLTYFFNGGTDLQMPGEQNILIPTPKAESPEMFPESQSFKIADVLMRSWDVSPSGVFIVNIPAAALAARTGRFDKTIEAAQFVDTCLGGIAERILGLGGRMMITSSHGSIEDMTDILAGEPKGYTTSNPVPFIFADETSTNTIRTDATLADIAPTMLTMLGLESPDEMTGHDLRHF